MNVTRSRRRQSGRPTVNDVARLADCSPMTVSRVINGGTSVRDETRLAVEAAIKQLGYAPNRAARSLAGASQLRIALLYANPSAAYLSELLIGCMDAASRLDAHLVVERCDADRDQAKMITRLAESMIDGFLLPPPLCDDTALLSHLRRAGTHAMLIGPGQAQAEHGGVVIDDYQAAFDMTRHIIALGHRRIGFIIGNPQQSATALRLAGFRAAMHEAGVPVDEALLGQGQFTYRSGLDAAMQMLALPHRPTAIFASNDDMAAGCIAAAHRNDMEVPRDLTVCGFDDTALASTIWPELTTIRQPIRQMAEAALDLLVQDIRAGRAGDAHTPRHTQFDYELIRRQSDAAPR
ncbi:MAG: LacI family transcriptional regulator [Novosphingobium sp. 28-62-57]|uniref:LacI family DNA-binding transcriptional regulator n=1 Tax=unclassified Novosphingobium TaxID=2644732 RepID=UPI000BCE8379|nr:MULTISPECIES: LacI family DNA-binding transcriptional regulator [unclassified Novosphingobium]OYW51303.1 MAG: LacI family transcriptional regulator [Novosphingobium sp. 12-62-10]OYZ45638.1 MAG: LacI family transcriptional regulator [Novosphingobium sp. 16-62-11]OZA40312.1 MAG: LacI family transcriptional regulator [Novosphingobium sp. 17-62-9]OYZ10558.1 MAG: LacI family transcriptional regulator [Novosphingobium sp. 28-62-57]HQS68032.1 LacI family DNA-binding transcriptional regulator [Novo